MGTFACIEFNRDKILLPKVSYEKVSYLETEGYHVYLIKPICEMTKKEWRFLEENLIKLNVEYIIIEGKENPFQKLIKIEGSAIKSYLAPYLLKYIHKYHLVPKEALYTHIGIIPGKIEETLAVITSMMHDVTALTLYVDSPASYKELLKEIYDKSRLSVKASVPCSVSFREADVIFDLSGQKSYAKWCKPSAIYIDYKKTKSRKKVIFNDAPPSIWNDFDIICGRQPIKVDILVAVLHVQGIYKRDYNIALKKLNTRILTIYKERIS